MFDVPPPMIAALRRVRGGMSGTLLWTYRAGHAEIADTIRGAAPEVSSERPAAVRAGARPYQRIGIA
jgi:hypothetical protein